jgi:hypothetical protein
MDFEAFPTFYYVFIPFYSGVFLLLLLFSIRNKNRKATITLEDKALQGSFRLFMIYSQMLHFNILNVVYNRWTICMGAFIMACALPSTGYSAFIKPDFSLASFLMADMTIIQNTVHGCL